MSIPTPPSDYHFHQGEALGLLRAARPTNSVEQLAAANVHATLALSAVLEAWRLEWSEPVPVELVETPDQTTVGIRILDGLVKVLGDAGHHISQAEGEDGLADDLLDVIVRHLPPNTVAPAAPSESGEGQPLAEWELELLQPTGPQQTGRGLIAAERRRQQEVEGYTLARDIEHGQRALLRAAVCYTMLAPNDGTPDAPPTWPWAPEYWKPKGVLRNLVRAGALAQAAHDVAMADDDTDPRAAEVLVTWCAEQIDALLDEARAVFPA